MTINNPGDDRPRDSSVSSSILEVRLGHLSSQIGELRKRFETQEHKIDELKTSLFNINKEQDLKIQKLEVKAGIYIAIASAISSVVATSVVEKFIAGN